MCASDGACWARLARAVEEAAGIVHERRWELLKVSELVPARSTRRTARCLLGTHDADGCIRVLLRDDCARSGWVSYEEVLATLLHELAHFEEPGHGPAFYALLRRESHAQPYRRRRLRRILLPGAAGAERAS